MWMYGVWLALACSASCATHSAQMEMYKYMVMCMSGGVCIDRVGAARSGGARACGDRVSLSALC